MVYIVAVEGGGPVKVGTTENLDARLKALRTACPFALALVDLMPGGREQERQAHDVCAAFRLRGEWFAPAALDVLLGGWEPVYA